MILLAAVSTASAYVMGVCVGIVLILVAAGVAKLIAYRPDLTDVKKRKIWFWVLAILCPVLTFAIAYIAVFIKIRVHNQQNAYMTAMCISAAVSFVLYVVLGFIAAKASKTGKISNWF